MSTIASLGAISDSLDTAAKLLRVLDKEKVTLDQLLLPVNNRSARHRLAAFFKAGCQFQEAGVPTRPGEMLYTLWRGDGRSAEQLLAAANFGRVWDYARMFVESKDFPISKAAEEADFEMVEFDHDPGTDEVLAEFVKRGLERPLAEDALRFGEKYPDLQLERPIVFLHEPWRVPDGCLRVLCLGCWVGRRYLGTFFFEGRWGRGCRFLGRRPRK